MGSEGLYLKLPRALQKQGEEPPGRGGGHYRIVMNDIGGQPFGEVLGNEKTFSNG
jgi:hypothetical protein